MSVCDIGYELDTKWVQYGSTTFYLLKTDKVNYESKTGKGWWSGTRSSYTANNGINFDNFSGYGGEQSWMALKTRTASGFQSHSSYKSLIAQDTNKQFINLAYKNESFWQEGSWFFIPTNCYDVDGKHRNAHTSSLSVLDPGYSGISVCNKIYTECKFNGAYNSLGKGYAWFVPCVKSTISFLRGATSDNIEILVDHEYKLDLSYNYYYQPIYNIDWYTPVFTVTNNNNYPIKITFDVLRLDGTSLGKTIWVVPANSAISGTQLKYAWEVKGSWIRSASMSSCTLTIEKLPNIKVKTTNTIFKNIDNMQVKLDDTNGFVRISKMYVKENDEWKLIMEDST